MMPETRITDTELLEAALIGLAQRRSEIEEKMAALRERLDGRGRSSLSFVPDSAAPDGAAPVRKRRRMSAAARKRIAAAMRKRWAALKQGSATKAASAKVAPVKKRR